MTNHLLFSAALLLTAFSGKAQQSYQIKGTLPGAADGIKVYLSDVYSPAQTIIDSSTIYNGAFEMKGHAPLSHPGFYSLLVDKKPGVPREKKLIRLFMGNDQVTIDVPIDSMPGYYYGTGGKAENVIIKGSDTQDLYAGYRASVKALSDRSRTLNDQYLQVYHIPAGEGIFNTQEGIAISRELHKVSAELRAKKLAFIHEHAKSVVAINQAIELLVSSNSVFTVTEINDIVKTIDPALSSSPLMQELNKMADNARATAKGEMYKDIPLTDLNGKTVRLSKYVKKGQYNMLEFWASWCGPCRAEIPHLRQLYKDVNPKDFQMISISIDEKTADWKKAVKEENMAWQQLCDLKGWQGPVAQQYKVMGVPYSVVLDKSGRIIASEVRGAELDLVLKTLLGDKITAF